MNENKHGDAYKVEMLRRMLAHETNACEEHYGHSWPILTFLSSI